MPLPYVKPGVTVNERVSPNVIPTILNPNVFAIVGPARGYTEHVETVLLEDNTPYTLAATNPNVNTIVVRDAANVLAAPFVKTTTGSNADYDVDTSELATTGQVRISRSMQTAISNGQEVVVYFEQSASPSQSDGVTAFVTLKGLTAVTPTGANASSQEPSVLVFSKGTLVRGTDYNVNNEGGSNPSIVRISASPNSGKFQTVYVSYQIGSNIFTDQPIQFNHTTAVPLPSGADGIVVRNFPAAPSAAPTKYQKGNVASEDLDYILENFGTSTPTIRRSRGSTTIGGLNNKLIVRISYQATPFDYYQPTLCYSQGDVESKFGPAFDSSGNVVSPVSLASMFAFQNGATQLVIQALHNGQGAQPAPPTGALTDWEDSFRALRVVQNVSVVVPIISAGNLSVSPSDSLSLQILSALQNHCRYMAAQENQFIIGIAGEDATIAGLASPAVLRAHADTLSDADNSEAMVLISPGAFTYANPITGVETDIGGQYVAAAIAGMLARYPVQMPLTRKRISGIVGLKTIRTETQKDQDAASGLLVVENKRGRIQVRHAITTNNITRASQELSVVRTKYWVMKSIVDALDSQVVGTILIDTAVNFTIQTLISGELELLLQQGAIVNYSDIQVRPDPNDDTTLQVRFSYLPAFPVNHIVITFSIDSTSGITFDQTTTTQGF